MRRGPAISTALVLVTITAAPLVSSEPTCAPRVKAVVFDGHKLVPGGLGPVRRAVEHELRRLGVQPTWVKDGDLESAGFVLQVVLLPHSAKDWGRTEETLGAVRLDGASASAVFVFYPSIKQALGVPADGTSILGGTPGTLWMRGLARIIVHEMLHVLLPGRPHDAAGLFASNLKARELLAAELELGAETHSALVARLCTAPF
jgi:hypothetical protein